MTPNEMTPEELLDAFNRSRKGAKEQPKVVEKEGKTVELNLQEAYERAKESSTVLSSNHIEQDADATFFDRVFSEPLQRAAQRQQAISQRVSTTIQNMGPSAMARQMQMPIEEQMALSSQMTDIPSVLVQTAANPLALVFDSASELVLIGAEGAVGLIPESFREGGKEQFAKLMQTQAGQMAFAAAAEGMEAWQKFQEEYPNEAANLISAFDIGAGKSSLDFIKTIASEFSPQKIVQIGMRKQTEPLAGDDKYIYNILFGRDVKTPEQVELTKDPSFLTGRQQQLANAEQLDQIDLAKKAGVSGNKTLQANFNALNNYMNDLEKQLMALLRQNESNIDPVVLMGNLRKNLMDEFNTLITQNSDVFKTNKQAKAEVGRLYKSMLSIIDEQGDTLEGFRNARKIFDSRANKIPGIDLSGGTLNPASLSAMAVRNAVNRSISDVVPESAQIFKTMSKIIPIKNSVGQKAAREAEARFGRFMQATGLDKMLGSTSISMALNAGLTLAGVALLSPITFVRNQLKRAKPGKLTARIAYTKRDVFDKINKAIASVSSPGERRRLLREKAAIYSYLNAAFKQVESELAQEENYDPSMYRKDGSKKSARGFLGPIKNNAGQTMTEFSTDLGRPYKGVPADEDIPTLVPGQTKEAIEYMKTMSPGQGFDLSVPIERQIINRAREHAQMRIDRGLSPMYQDGE